VVNVVTKSVYAPVSESLSWFYVVVLCSFECDILQWRSDCHSCASSIYRR